VYGGEAWCILNISTRERWMVTFILWLLHYQENVYGTQSIKREMGCFANLEQVNGETNNGHSVHKKIDFHIILYHLLFSVFSYHKHLLCNSCSLDTNMDRIAWPRIHNSRGKAEKQTRWRTQTKCIQAVWVQEIQCRCFLQDCIVAMLLIPHNQNSITHTAPATPQLSYKTFKEWELTIKSSKQVKLPMCLITMSCMHTKRVEVKLHALNISRK